MVRSEHTPLQAADRPDGAVCTTSPANERAVLVVLLVGTFLAPLDSSIVNIALPQIAARLGQTLAEVSWVATAYLLTSASLLLSMGRVGDVWGLRRLYVGGLAVFAVGSAACAASTTLEMLVLSRIAQAVGASMLFAAGPALVTRTFPAGRRGRALGYISLAVSAGLTVGPALGGLLVGTFGWPSIFIINIPLALIAGTIAWRLLPDECPRGERFDIVGALLAGLALLSLLLGLGRIESSAYGEAGTGVAVAVLLGAVFLWWERRAPHPMVDLRLFSSHAFSAGITAALLAYLSLFSVTFTMPFYLLRVQGFDPRVAGLVLTITPLAMAAIAPFAGRASDRMGSRGLATIGLVTLAAGLLGVSMLAPQSPVVAIGACLVCVGSGMAVFQTPNTASVLKATPRQRAGIGSAFVAEARNVGMAIGIALTAAVLGAQMGGGLPGGEGALSPEAAGTFMTGMALACRLCAGIALGAAAVSWFTRSDDRPVEASPARP